MKGNKMANTFSGTGSLSGVGTLATSVAIVYSIGDTGPGGGIVFYDAGSTQAWGRYMEAATTNSSPSWTDAGYIWNGVTSGDVASATAIGTGLANTNAIIAQSNTANRAATVCDAYAGGGLTNWHLPSKDELAELRIQRATVGGFNTSGGSSRYWSSSSVYSGDNVFFQYFFNGQQDDYPRSFNADFLVRPVRYFA
jgi:hypothetical protein